MLTIEEEHEEERVHLVMLTTCYEVMHDEHHRKDEIATLIGSSRPRCIRSLSCAASP